MKSLKRYHAGEMRKIIPAFVFLLNLIISFSAFGKGTIPDFAYPVTVELQQDSLLKESLRAGKPLQALRSAMDLVIAKGLLSNNENLSGRIELIDSLAHALKKPYSNLAYLIEAQLLEEGYSRNRWVYDSRTLPLEIPYPVNTDSWSGDMFKSRILSLVDSALNGIKGYQEMPISEISMLLTDCKGAESIGLSVKDFIGFKGAGILQKYSGETSAEMIPFYPEEAGTTIQGRIKTRAKSILQEIYKSNDSQNSVIKALAAKEIFSLLPDDQREKYLQDILTQLKDTEGEGALSVMMWQNYGRENNRKYYTEIKAWLEKYPEGFGNIECRNALEEICRPSVSVSFPSKILPGKKASGEVSVSNLEGYYLLIYKLSKTEYDDYDRLIEKKFNFQANPHRVLNFNNSEEVPFKVEKRIELPELPEGLYAIIPSKSPKLKAGWNKNKELLSSNYSTIRVSEIALITGNDSGNKNSGKVYVVKGENQEPVEGAKVTYFTGNNKSAQKVVTTNDEGWVRLPEGYYRIVANYGNSETVWEAGFSYYRPSQRKIGHLDILTDLAIYRPGDTVKYAVIGWLQDSVQNRLIKDKEVVISLQDVNFQEIGKDTLCLNTEGRNTGSFVLPKGRLLGNYRLSGTFIEKELNGGGMSTIAVEEYKLPPFKVNISQKSASNEDVLQFEGTATTFSGLPVIDAETLINISFLPWRWGFNGVTANYSLTCITNNEGLFSFELPVKNLKGTIYERGRYSVTAEVTSNSGETEKSSPLFFYLGAGNEIRPAINDKICVSGDSITLNVPVFDMAGLPVQKKVDYTIFELERPDNIFKGSFTSPLLKLSSKEILSGRYRLEFHLGEEKDTVITETVFWRYDDSKSPYPTTLWVPQSQYTYEEGQKEVEVCFGSYNPEWLLMVTSNPTQIIKEEWLSPCDSLIKKKISIPEGNPTIFISLAGMYELNGATSQIKIVPKKSLERMTVEAVSFRPDISSGDKEEWTFHFKVDEQSTPFVNALAVMSDKALNSLRDFRWQLNMWQPSYYNRFNLSLQRVSFNTSSIFFKGGYSNLEGRKPITPIPGFETYGYGLVPYLGIRNLEKKLYRSAVTQNLMSAKDESMDYASAEGMAETIAEDAVNEEIENNEELRPVEMPLAFFMPELKSDADGILSLRFTVPNFNTTWQLQVAGYNEDLLHATIIVDAVASKKVMVKSSLPGYLRTGDKAQISATLFNNSSEKLNVGGMMEVFNPLTGEILKSEKFSEAELSPSGNRIISIDYKVPQDLSIIGIRSYATAPGYSDGEQGYVTVLPSSNPVTEAMTFYAKSNQNEIKLSLHDVPEESIVTLKYCDNPLWDVLLSLPSLSEGENNSALSISRSLYGEMTANKIINGQENIALYLYRILTNEDSLLTKSPLEKDAELKLMTLEATPWINDAQSETNNIRRLEKYLDKEATLKRIESQIAKLRVLQKPDGGFSWFEGMESSPFITQGVIETFAYLKEEGLLNNVLNEMAGKAVSYYDNYMLDLERGNKHVSYYTMMDYMYARNKLGYSVSTSLKKLMNSTIDSISNNWKYWDNAMKAKGGIVLLANKKNNTVVNEIAQSLIQFLSKKSGVSQEATVLEFFIKKGAHEKEIEKLRENLYLQKETLNWTGERDAVRIISTLLSVTPDTIIERKAPVITIEGLDIKLPESQELTGNYTIDLSDNSLKGKLLKIEREGGIPAWGGVVYQYVAPIEKVKQERVENLSVTKKIYIEEPQGKVKETEIFQQGDKIKVVILLSLGKDMDYVVIKDNRSGCLQPTDTRSGLKWEDGMIMYREIGKEATSFFIEHLKAGEYVISYDCHAERKGEYSLGIVEAQCLYSPAQVAHSSGSVIKIQE